MTVLTDRLQYPNLSRTFLVEVTAGDRLLAWAATGGYSSTYEAAVTRQVVGVNADGVPLAETTSVALVESGNNTFYYDPAAGKVYVHIEPVATALNPVTLTMQAFYRFHLSDRGRVYEGFYYDPRVKKLPAQSLRVEHQFGDPGQVGGGTITFANEDGFFDTLSGLQWDAGSITMRLGVDNPKPPHTMADYSEFDIVGFFLTKSWVRQDDEFTLTFEEVKSRTKRKIPTAYYTREEYPGMRESDVGKVKQIGYGRILDVAPVCVNEAAKLFQVAGHAIRGFAGFRVKNEATGAWVNTTVPLADRNNALAQYTLTAWDLKQEVSCDFYGRIKADGTLMDNPADVVYDLLTVWLGEDPAGIA